MRQYRPLNGTRILAIETAASLPAGTRTLADLGADVVRIAEPPGIMGPYIRVFDSTLMNKSSIGIDLKRPEGCELARRLAIRADAVCYNFRPRAIRAFGLDYESLREVRRDIISLQLSGYGAPGPWQDFPAYGPSVEAAGGMNSMMGSPDEPPQRVGGGVFADTLAGRYAALALCAALMHRRKTGEGQYIDLSMCESITVGIGDHVLRAGLNGAPPRRQGNRDEHFAPQGIYPCFGDDEWVAISIVSDEEWRAFRALLGHESLQRTDFETIAGRLQHHDQIDEVISSWTRRREKLAAATLLQQHGIAAGPVQKTRDIPVDEHHQARHFFQRVRHPQPILGHSGHPHMRLPARFVGYARPRVSMHRPEGWAARRILRRWLDADDAEISRLKASGAFEDERPVVPPGSEPPTWFGERTAQHDTDFALRVGLETPGDS
jgi:crotonobetainyl-CoA:carnitine CoA-transferase CaiB-like acyl-CoA transferase